MVDIWVMATTPARRELLLRSVAADPSIRVAGTAPTFAVLRSLIAETPAEVAVVDLQPDMDSASVREWLLELLDLVAIVVLASEHDPELFHRLVRSRTGGILRRDASPEQIVHAVRSVVSGLMIFDSDLMPPRPDESTLIEPLTVRESEVLRLLADGLGNKEIAARLNISEHTIKFHIRSILGKLGASSRTEAVSRGLRAGLIEL